MSAFFERWSDPGYEVLYRKKFARYFVRDDMKEALIRYLVYGVHPGGFLFAVLANDLFEAAGRADEDNQKALFEYAKLIYNELPMGSYGNEHVVNEWAAARIEERMGA